MKVLHSSLLYFISDALFKKAVDLALSYYQSAEGSPEPADGSCHVLECKM